MANIKFDFVWQYFLLLEKYYWIIKGDVNLKSHMLCKSTITYQRGRKDRAIISYLGKELRKKTSIEGVRKILKEGKCIVRNIIGWEQLRGKNREEHAHDTLDIGK